MAVVGAVAVAVGGAAVAVPALGGLVGSQASDAAAIDGAGLRPVVVERGALATGTVLSGTLSRGSAVPLAGTAEGVLTALPEAGDVLKTGSRVFEANGEPAFFLRGEVPLWRPVQLGSKGKDVRSLNEALAGAGLLDRVLVDDTFGAGTSAAVASLFELSGYAPPSATEEGRDRIEQAERAYDGAVAARDDAAEALKAATEGPSDLEVAMADAAVADAESALVAARESGRGAALAQAQLDAARADRAALDKVPDASAELAAFEGAKRAVADASQDVEIARAQSVSPADVVILDAAALRVASVPVRVGAPASGDVLTWTGSTVHAEAQVTRSQQASLSAGDEVRVRLPDGSEVGGVIAATDEPGAEAGSGGAGVVDGADAAEVPSDMAVVRVDIADQSALAGSVGAAVRIEVVAESVEDALMVPVTALVALAEGGYAVEKVTPGSPSGSGTLVPVELGLVAEAKVQVTSAQLAEGDEVLVP